MPRLRTLRDRAPEPDPDLTSIERRDASLDEGLEALRAALTDLAEAPLGELCDTVLSRLAPDGGEDDIALMAVRGYPEDEPRPASAGPERLPPG